MPAACVVASPGLRGALESASIPAIVLPPLPAVSAAAWAAWLLGVDVPTPVVLALDGSACDVVVGLAAAQRAARRPPAAYVLVDPPGIRAGADWPDAPVVVVTADVAIARAAGLRGWQVVRLPADIGNVISELVEG